MAEQARALRIAHVTPHLLGPSLGGTEIVVDTLVRRQRALGHEVSVLTRWRQWRAARGMGLADGVLPLPPSPRPGGDPFASIGPWWLEAMAAACWQRRHRFDAWHIHGVYPLGWALHDRLAAMGARVVLTSHGADLQHDAAIGYGWRRHPRHERRIRVVLARAESLSAISPSIADAMRELGGREQAIHPIPNGVDVARFAALRARREQTRAALGISPDERLVLTIARHEPVKGLDLIPPVLARLEGRMRWLVMTDRPATLAAELADPRVMLVQQQPPAGMHGAFPPDEVASLHAAADLLVVPSRSESFGLVALEAMAAGTPVVAHDVAGLRDLVRDGREGRLVCPGDADAMACAITRLLADPEARAAMGRAGQERARAYDWDGVVASYIALYRGGRG